MKCIIYCLDGISPLYVKDTTYYTRQNFQTKSLVLPTRLCWTPIEWTSFATGRKPQDHGVSSISDKLYNRNDVRSSTFIWDDCDGAGLTLGIYHLPVCDTPTFTSPIVRFMVSGYSSYPFEVSPNRLSSEVLPLANPHIFDDGKSIFPILNDNVEIDKKWYIEQCRHLSSFARYNIGTSFENFTKCLNMINVDIGLIYIHELDLASHYFVDLMKQELIDLYEETFYRIDETNRRFTPDFFFIVSDHGINPFDKSIPLKTETMIRCENQFLRVGNKYPRYIQSAYHDQSTKGCFMSDKRLDVPEVISLCHFRDIFRSSLCNEMEI